MSIRRVVGRDNAGRILFGDVVGDLVHLDDERARVEARAGLSDIDLSHVAFAREAPPSTAEILALEAVCARGWRAAETETAGGWLLRADAGFTGRANSALPLGRPESLEATIEIARKWYASRGLPLKVQVPIPARRLLDSALGDLDFWGADEVHVLTARTDMIDISKTDEPVQISESPDEGWYAGYHYRGRSALPPGARELITRHDRALFVSVRDGDRTLAIGRGAVDGEWLGITAVEVAPDHRRRGLARRVLAGLVAAARERHDAKRVYLQVESTNQPAVSLYLSAGFWHHHDYRYRTANSP